MCSVLLVLLLVVPGFLQEVARKWTNADMRAYLGLSHVHLEKSYLPWALLEDDQYDFEEGYITERESQQHLLMQLLELRLFRRFNTVYDPRLVPALWLNALNERIGEHTLDQHFTLPFRWASSLDLMSPMDELSHIPSCKAFQKELHLKSMSNCIDRSAPPGFPRAEITGPLDESLDERARRYIGANYLMHSRSIPERAVLLGVGPRKTNGFKPLVVPLQDCNSVYQKSDLVSLARGYTDSRISLQNQVKSIRDAWTEYDTQLFPLDEDLQKDIFRIVEDRAQDLYLAPSEFNLSMGSYLQYLTAKLPHLGEELDQKLALGFFAASDGKYFHESALRGKLGGSHFDWRFFRKAHYSTYERITILHRLTRAWLRFSADVGLKTWLAHGTLLGWHWNNVTMPWDNDVDVQMTLDSLFTLARNYNQSVVLDFTDNVGCTGAHMYLVDVNPHFGERTKGEGSNVIDARFIDMTTGMYVDITGLSITSDFAIVQNSTGKASSELHQMFDTEYSEMAASALGNGNFGRQYYGNLRELEKTLWDQDKLYNCKNSHFYTSEELLPLQQVHFEGVSALVPHLTSQLLRREYRRGLTLKKYNGWSFRSMLGLWVPEEVCTNQALGKVCDDAEWLLEEQLTRGTRKGIGRPLKVDTWMMQRNEDLKRFSHGTTS